MVLPGQVIIGEIHLLIHMSSLKTNFISNRLQILPQNESCSWNVGTNSRSNLGTSTKMCLAGEAKVSEDSSTQQQVPEKQGAPIRIVLPFKHQKSTNTVCRQLGDLSRKINVDISPVYTSRKIKDVNNQLQSEGRPVTPRESTVQCLSLSK